VPAAGNTARTSSPPAGAPLLAVADGTLHTIGFNKIGGYRLWLRDTEGDEFYYAHLSAYSPLAGRGAQRAGGDVIGFVGNTG
jgi:murein DD-endopeptidase MepM/ murein hydrolase activator NlpD